MKKLMVIFALILSLLLSSAAMGAEVFSGAENDARIESIYDHLCKSNDVESLQELLDNVYAATPGAYEYWNVFILMQTMGDTLDFTAYKKALEEKVETDAPASAVTNEFLAMILYLLGSDSEFIETTMEEGPGGLGLMSYVFAVTMMANGIKGKAHTIDSLLTYIGEQQHTDGGFCVVGESSDLDATTHVIIGLSPLYNENAAATDIINKALCFIPLAQVAGSGGFFSMGCESLESCAMVVTALSCIGINPLSYDKIAGPEKLFDIMASYENEDGGYAHLSDGESNVMATREALMAYIAYSFLLEGRGSMLDYSGVAGDAGQADVAEQADVADAGEASGGISAKLLISIIIIAAALILCAVYFFILKKRSAKSYALIAIIAALLVLAANLISFSSAENYYSSSNEISGNTIKTTISITCENVAGEKDYIPADGVILAKTTVEIAEGESAYDQLVRAAKENSIQFESDDGSYLSGIGYIYEFDFGDLSGWVFKVNGEYSDSGSSLVRLSEGDEIEWIYSLELGRDVGSKY